MGRASAAGLEHGASAGGRVSSGHAAGGCRAATLGSTAADAAHAGGPHAHRWHGPAAAAHEHRLLEQSILHATHPLEAGLELWE